MPKTVRDACKLAPNALDIRVIDQIERLEELIDAEGDGEAYFNRTHITDGMRTLLTEGIARLASKSSQAVFHLKQSMGGGKTHLMLGFGLLAKHRALRQNHIADMSHWDSFEAAQVAAFNGRNTPERFFWGELAHQLGKGEVLKKFWESGPKAPDPEDWAKLFDDNKPTLILLDEMPPYFHILATQQVGAGTVADIATRAFANLLVAASNKANVCVVVSDLHASYETGGKLIQNALKYAAQELGRMERSITPVDLTSNEIYEILRKRLFTSLPSEAEIEEVAEAYAKALTEASKAKVIHRSPEEITEEIVNTYPFHPRLRSIVALFKDNEKYKQTRGLMELISRLLKSVWKRSENDVFLVGPQHFDLSITDVRDKISEISELRDVIARDVYDSNHSAHAQVIDQNLGGEKARQVAVTLLISSLSTAVNAVRGLTQEELVECLTVPMSTPSDYITALEDLRETCWYLHEKDNRFYFDRQENLVKLLESLAQSAPQPLIDELIKKELEAMFKPTRKSVYEQLLALPSQNDAREAIKRGRVLLIVEPDNKMPPEEVTNFFNGVTEKNSLCVLTGTKSLMASLTAAARHVYAAKKAETRIPEKHHQRDELERKQEAYQQNLFTTILSLFDQVCFPVALGGGPPQLKSKPLSRERDTTKPFNGEDQIERTLTTSPQKVFLDVQADFDLLRTKAEDLLWPATGDDVRWEDMKDAYSEKAGMPWMPAKGLEALKGFAFGQGIWEDLGNGYLTKRPKKKKTSVQVTPATDPDDSGKVRLKVEPQNSGPNPKIYYCEDGVVSESSPKLEDNNFETNALRVQFLVADPSGKYETGDPYLWKNSLVLRCEMTPHSSGRRVELRVAPRGDIRYTLDGSEPRNGNAYKGPIEIGNDAVTVYGFAECEGLEVRETFQFPAIGSKPTEVMDLSKPASLEATKGFKKLDSRQKTYAAVKEAKDRDIIFESVQITVGEGARYATYSAGEIALKADLIESILATISTDFPPETSITMSFKKARFHSGHDLKAFLEALGLEAKEGEIKQ